ncbi:formylglycine-generating enzyme family protein [Leifsonia sp. Root60]|uniref:formylglycine-generating enzyme family protein n=1 Tax=unclassified Leifsonia TaxID=2663824 RepID=UPI003FA5B3EA
MQPARPDRAAPDLAVLPVLITVPAGTIELRDARSETARSVELQSFEIGRTAVTAAEWAAVARPVPRVDDPVPQHPVTWFEAVNWCNGASDAAGLRRAYVVDGGRVSWDGSADGFRLPTEAEWEFAARAGSTGPRYGSLDEIAWSSLDDIAGPQPVAGKAPNAFGLFDTIGNVWEWCWDYADTARYGDYRSLRGGGWADREWSLRASVRRGSAPDAVLEDVGFRVARGVVGSPGGSEAQGWSDRADRKRADVRGPRPVGWTPLRFEG